VLDWFKLSSIDERVDAEVEIADEDDSVEGIFAEADVGDVI